MNQEYLKIPKDRIAVLIGTKGEERRKLEKLTNCKIVVDSEEGEVTIRGEPIDVYQTVPIVKAIGRGFNPEIAQELLKEDYGLKIVEIREFTGKSKKALTRVKSRVIGTGGKTRTTIEDLTDTHIVIYGKTVSIIGTLENIEVAAEAVENILRGSRHGSVYAWLEDKKKRLFQEFYESRRK